MSKERELLDREKAIHRSSIESEQLRNQIKEERLKHEQLGASIRLSSEEALRRSIQDGQASLQLAQK
jgi:hypothetical protein